MQQSRFCTYCGKEVDNKTDICFGCGCRIYGGKNYCHNCGAKLNPNQVICVQCGSPLEERTTYEKNLNKTLAGVFALLLGGLGIHKFYLGQPISGILYLIFSWTGIPFFLGFIDGISLFCMSQERFNKKYNKEILNPSVHFKKRKLDNTPKQNVGKREILLWVCVLFILVLIAGFLPDKQKKTPVVENVRASQEMPTLTIPLLTGRKSNAKLSDLVSCKKVEVTYSLDNGKISIMKPACFGANSYPYQDMNLRKNARRFAKKIEYIKQAEVHLAVPKKTGQQVTISNFVYGQKNYLGIVCIGYPNIENICEAVTKDIASKESLF